MARIKPLLADANPDLKETFTSSRTHGCN